MAGLSLHFACFLFYMLMFSREFFHIFSYWSSAVGRDILGLNGFEMERPLTWALRAEVTFSFPSNFNTKEKSDDAEDLENTLGCLADSCGLSLYKHVPTALNQNRTGQPSRGEVGHESRFVTFSMKWLCQSDCNKNEDQSKLGRAARIPLNTERIRLAQSDSQRSALCR